MASLLIVTAAVGSATGGYVPALLGDTAILDLWTVVGALFGGLFGIWVGVKLQKRFG